VPQKKWADYPLGVAWALEQAGFRLRGANLYIQGDVPLGAGLSSSAALEVSTGFALLDLDRYPIESTKLALLCQKAENEFVGARCRHHGSIRFLSRARGKRASARLPFT